MDFKFSSGEPVFSKISHDSGAPSYRLRIQKYLKYGHVGNYDYKASPSLSDLLLLEIASLRY